METGSTAEAVQGDDMANTQETTTKEEAPETREQRRLRLAKARLDIDAEEAAIAAEEKTERDAAVKVALDRLDAHGAAAKADVDAKCEQLAAVMRPVVEVWNAAVDGGAAEILYRVFGYSEPGSGKIAHMAAGHSIQGVSRRLTEADDRYITEAIEQIRAAAYEDITSRVEESKRLAGQE